MEDGEENEEEENGEKATRLTLGAVEIHALLTQLDKTNMNYSKSVMNIANEQHMEPFASLENNKSTQFLNK